MGSRWERTNSPPPHPPPPHLPPSVGGGCVTSYQTPGGAALIWGRWKETQREGLAPAALLQKEGCGAGRGGGGGGGT